MTKDQKLQRQIDKRCHWHKWFAWYPVTFVVKGVTYRAWLEYVGRKDVLTKVMGEMYYESDAVVRGEICPIEDLLVKAITEPDIIDKRDR